MSASAGARSSVGFRLPLAFAAALAMLVTACASPLDVEVKQGNHTAEAANDQDLDGKILNSLPPSFSQAGSPSPGGACGFDPHSSSKGKAIVSGWAVIDASSGATPDKIILKLDQNKSTGYMLISPSSRPDVVSYFKNNDLSKSGFYRELSRQEASSIKSASVLQFFQGKLYECPNVFKFE